MISTKQEGGKNTSSFRARLVGGVGLVAALVALNGVCTQMIASSMHYHPSLGSPLFGLLYSPLAWWGWIFRYYQVAPNAFNRVFILFTIGFATAILGYTLYIGFATRSSRKHEGVHGTAEFATIEDVRKSGLLPGPGNEGENSVYCGGYDGPDGRLYYLRHTGPEHIVALAPTRSGKGVGLVIPTLLSWSESVFVLDRKGENYAITAGWRQKEAGNLVLRFDPAEPGVGCSWNALAEIRFGTRYQVSDAQNIALMVVDDDGRGVAGDHFRSAAYELLTGVILHALYKSEKVGRVPGLGDCATMLTGVGDFATKEAKGQKGAEGEDKEPDADPKALEGLFSEMANIDVQVAADNHIAIAAAKEAKLVIAGVGKRMANTPARELGSIISTANNALALYRDPIVAENTTRVDFKVADLMDHDKPVSLYFVTTPRNADRMRPLARLLLTQIVLSLADRMQYDEVGRSRTVHKHRLLLMLDEFPTLGKLEIFESALAYIAGYGMKSYLITQDVQQLYKAYTNFESIISNCHVRIAFAPNKVETAEWMSKMTGQTTVINEQITTSGKRFGAVLDQVSRSYQEVQRPLMTPDEIMRLPGPKKDAKGDIIEAGEMLVFVAGQPPIRGRQILYFTDPVFSARSKLPPPQSSDRIRGEGQEATREEGRQGSQGVVSTPFTIQ